MRLNKDQAREFARLYADRKVAERGFLPGAEYLAWRALYRHVAFSVARHDSSRGFADIAQAHAQLGATADSVCAPFMISASALAIQYPPGARIVCGNELRHDPTATLGSPDAIQAPDWGAGK